MSNHGIDCQTVQRELAASRGAADELADDAAVRHVQECDACRLYAADCRFNS